MGRFHERQAAAEVTSLAIFDFDDTLFRSPTPPGKTHGERAHWWRTAESLLPPFVPERPGPEWWNASVVGAARKAINDPSTKAVILTGRRDVPALRSRVENLLRSVSLRFEDLLMNPSMTGAATLWKSDATKGLLAELPNVKVVSVWDDDAKNVTAVESAARLMGREVEPHFVSLREEMRYLTGKLRRSLTT